MRSGRRILHWNTEMPANVRRHHEHPETSDNYGAIRRAANEPVGADGILANDTNFQAAWSTTLVMWVIYGGHWKDPKRNGYTRVKRRLLPGTRRMTRRERARGVWTWEELRRLRRPNGERPRTAAELYTYGVLHGVVQIGEEKHAVLGRLGVMERLVEDARAHDHPAWFMVLDDHAPQHKVAATRGAGGQIAMIFGTDGPQRPPDWAQWAVYPDRMWGPDYTRHWLPA